MLPALAVCLVLGATPPAELTEVSGGSSRIAIDACVDADHAEVLRLLEIELVGAFAKASGPREVGVSCTERPDVVRLFDPARPELGSRILDLTAWGVAARKARTRELALVIAEFVREAHHADVPAPVERHPTRDSRATPDLAPAPRVEVALLSAAEKYAGGHAQIGLSAGVRVRSAFRLVWEARAGARTAETLRAQAGQISAKTLVGSVGVGVDVFPRERRAGLMAVGRLELDWVFISGSPNDREPRSEGRSVNGMAWLGGVAASAWFSVSRNLRLLAEPALLIPIRPLSLEDRSLRVSAISGVGAAATLGLLLRL